jgi:predicted acyl esterase
MSPDSLSRRDFTVAMFAGAGSLLLPRGVRTPESASTSQSDVMVAMRDGVRLATDVYSPADPGRYPVILERTPYNKTAPSRSERTPSNPTPLSRARVADFFVERGYVVATSARATNLATYSGP